MRFRDTLNVSFTKDLKESNIPIAPMLLLPFVENSFKHGAIINGQLTINIHINNQEDIVHFLIENSCNDQNDGLPGLGLDNIKKRLELLYKGKYTLDIDSKPHLYTVSLTLNIKNDS